MYFSAEIPNLFPQQCKVAEVTEKYLGNGRFWNYRTAFVVQIKIKVGSSHSPAWCVCWQNKLSAGQLQIVGILSRELYIPGRSFVTIKRRVSYENVWHDNQVNVILLTKIIYHVSSCYCYSKNYYSLSEKCQNRLARNILWVWMNLAFASHGWVECAT